MANHPSSVTKHPANGVKHPATGVKHPATAVNHPPSAPPDTLLVYWGQSNTIDYVGNVAFATFTTSNGKMWFWLKHTDGVYYSSAGSADATGSTGNSFINSGVITTAAPTPTSHYPPLLHGLRGMSTAGISAQAMLVAQGTTRLYDDWDPAAVSGKLLFNVLTHEVDAALASGTFTLSPSCRIVWHSYIGEADSAGSTTADVYQARYQSIITALRARYSSHVNYFVITKTHPSIGASVATVRAAQDALAVANANTYTVESSDLPVSTPPHLSSHILGYMAWRGIRAARGTRTLGLAKATSGNSWSIAAANRVFVGAATMTGMVYMVKTISGAITQTREMYRCGYNVTTGFNLQVLAPVSPTGSENARVLLDIANGAGTHLSVASNVTLQQNKIHQITFTVDGANMKLYLDGVQIGATTACVGYTSGAFSNYVGRYPAGSTSEIGIAAVSLSDTTALTQAEIVSALTTAKASDNFAMPHKTELMLAGEAGANGSTAWIDADGILIGFTANAGVDYAVMEAAYAT